MSSDNLLSVGLKSFREINTLLNRVDELYNVTVLCCIYQALHNQYVNQYSTPTYDVYTIWHIHQHKYMYTHCMHIQVVDTIIQVILLIKII